MQKLGIKSLYSIIEVRNTAKVLGNIIKEVKENGNREMG